jgi:predicted histone-like DNA-binding protein
MKYRPVLRKNPRDLKDPGKYYPNPVYEGKLKFREIAREISMRTSLSVTDAIASLEAMTEVIPFFLSRGYIIQLGEFGTFRITFEGTGEKDKTKVSEKNIVSQRINFLPRPELAKQINSPEPRKTGKKK